MKRSSSMFLALAVATSVLLVGAGRVSASDVFQMPNGQTSLEFVSVGNGGNAGELSGVGAGG